ncbi:omega-6 fatty acid desaturase (delta-12 desaturase) [Variovorax sp. OAS795]|uniref:fatty acid desaturase n=1 Tax=Variovorax sp. OAS795 TaxID=3034231 RepID=UPI003396D14B
MSQKSSGAGHEIRARLLSISAQYSRAQPARSAVQLTLTFSLWLATYVAGLAFGGGSLLGAVASAAVAAVFVVRLFMIQHDCGHRSFFSSDRANDMLGFCLGVVTMTPYRCWRRFHAQHHSTSGNLDQRGFGDIHTLTTREYEALTPAQQRRYRIYRHPLVLLLIGPPYLFILRQRTTYKVPLNWRAERRSIHLTNLGCLSLLVLPCVFCDPIRVIVFHLTMMSFAAIAGVWLFYIQHQFPNAYWRHEGEWESWQASMEGATYYDLPAWLRWVTASIGLHHIHHLDARIPNYRLYECFKKHSEFGNPPRITFLQSIACLKLRLWDPLSGRMVPLPRADSKA